MNRRNSSIVKVRGSRSRLDYRIHHLPQPLQRKEPQITIEASPSKALRQLRSCLYVKAAPVTAGPQLQWKAWGTGQKAAWNSARSHSMLALPL
jgi:hypothetical protein